MKRKHRACLGSLEPLTITLENTQSTKSEEFGGLTLGSDIVFTTFGSSSDPVVLNKEQVQNIFDKGKDQAESNFFQDAKDSIFGLFSGSIDFTKGVISETASLADDADKIVTLVKAVKELQGAFADEEDVRKEVAALDAAGIQTMLASVTAQVNAMNAAQRKDLVALLEQSKAKSSSASGFTVSTPMIIGGIGLLAVVALALARK